MCKGKSGGWGTKSVELQYILDSEDKKRDRRTPCGIVELHKPTERSLKPHGQYNITQDMKYRCSLMKYAEKYGVSRASRKYDKSRAVPEMV